MLPNSRPQCAILPLAAVARERAWSRNRRALGSRLPFRGATTAAAEPLAALSESLANQDRGDVHAVQEADTNAAVVRALTVEFAPQSAALYELQRGLCSRGTTRFVARMLAERVVKQAVAADAR